MRDFSQIPPWSPCPWEHEEADPRIDKMLVACEQAIRQGFFSERAAMGIMLSRGMQPEVAFVIARGGAVLASHDD